MKKIKLIGVYVIFVLSFFSHFMYDIFPNSIFSILFPVNESIWEHMKLIVTPVFIYGIVEYIIYKIKNIDANNFIFSYAVSTIGGIVFYLIIYLPIHYIFGHNLLFSMALLFITFIVIEYSSYQIINYIKIKNSNLLGITLLMFIYIIFGTFTYFPLENNLFFDTQSKSYGINKRM